MQSGLSSGLAPAGSAPLVGARACRSVLAARPNAPGGSLPERRARDLGRPRASRAASMVHISARPLASSHARAMRALPRSDAASPSLPLPPPESRTAHSPPARLAVFVSGGGSNAAAIQAAISRGEVRADVGCMVSSSVFCGAAERARAAGTPLVLWPPPKKTVPIEGDETPQTPAELLATLAGHGVTHIILAGYLRLVPFEVVEAFPRRALNIHPGLLPSFGGPGMYGHRVHAAVIASGARYSGPTVHFVDVEYDKGRILDQAVVPVLPDDTPTTLAERVLAQEHRLYPRCVSALVDGRISFREDGVPVIWDPR